MKNTTLKQFAAMDVAPDPQLTQTERERSFSLLREVLADDAVIFAPARAGWSRSTRWGLAIAGSGAAAVLVVGAVVVAPHVLNRVNVGDGGGPLTAVELASWTSTPSALSSSTLSNGAKSWCLGSMESGPGAGSPATFTNADERGDVASMIIHRAGYTMLCMTGPDGTGFWELDGDPSVAAPTVAADAVSIESAGSHGDGSTGFTYVEGLAGSSVTAITVRDAGKTFSATVEDGRWTAWWPTADPHGTITGTVTITTTDGASRTVKGENLQEG
jgi:hypothetical protein